MHLNENLPGWVRVSGYMDGQEESWEPWDRWGRVVDSIVMGGVRVWGRGLYFEALS